MGQIGGNYDTPPEPVTRPPSGGSVTTGSGDWTDDRPPRDKEGDGLSSAPGVSPVAQYITWTVAGARNLEHKTILMWVKIKNHYINRGFFGLIASGASDESFSINAHSYAYSISFETRWSLANGIWRTSSTPDLGQLHLAVTYDNASTANVPSIYFNGVLQTLVTVQAPSGTYVGGTNNTLDIGRTTEQAYTPDGRIMAVAMYNRLLSSDDINIAYDRGPLGHYPWAEHNFNGLIFCPNLNMATGIGREAFTSSSITSDNKLLNYVDGAQGTVTGTWTGEGKV